MPQMFDWILYAILVPPIVLAAISIARTGSGPDRRP